MLSYAHIIKWPSSFRSLTGISLKEFDQLYEKFVPIWEQNERKRLSRSNRRRAIGGGRPYELDLRTLLVMTLIWLHLYLNMETLGFFFGVHKSAISRNTRRVLPVLRQLGEDTVWWKEPPDRGQGRNMTEVLAECPDLLAILDVTEARIERPQDPEQQRKHFSGKKRYFTRKFGLIVNEHGQIRGMTLGRPGHVHDLVLFRESHLLPLLSPQVTVLGDKGFEGLHKDLPEHSIATPHKTYYKRPIGEAEKWANRDLASQRIVVENTICELKHFKVLADRFRQCKDRLDDAAWAVVALVNPRIDNRLAVA
jgi:hypothetical protein